MRHLVEAGAHHLRLAAQAVRILHLLAVAVRVAQRAARQPVAVARRHGALAFWPRTAWMRSSKGVSEPLAASTVIAPTASAASNTRSSAARRAGASAVEACVPLSSARPLRGAEHERLQPGVRQRFQRAQTLAGYEGLAHADQHAGHVRERRQVAAGADRAFLGHHRQHVVREQGEHPSITSSRTPDTPCARLAALSSSISRTTGALIGCRRRRCARAPGSSAAASAGRRRCASAPACRSRC